MNKLLLSAIAVVGLTAATAFAQMGGQGGPGQQGPQGGMMGSQQSQQMMGNQMMTQDMMRDMAGMMQQMNGVMGKLSGFMEHSGSMNHGKMMNLSKMMGEMSANMKDMSERHRRHLRDQGAGRVSPGAYRRRGAAGWLPAGHGGQPHGAQGGEDPAG